MAIEVQKVKIPVGNRSIGLTVRYIFDDHLVLEYRGYLEDMVAAGAITAGMRDAMQKRLPPANKSTRNGRRDDDGQRYRWTKVREQFGIVRRILELDRRLYELPGVRRAAEAFKASVERVTREADHAATIFNSNAIRMESRRQRQHLRLVWNNPAM